MRRALLLGEVKRARGVAELGPALLERDQEPAEVVRAVRDAVRYRRQERFELVPLGKAKRVAAQRVVGDLHDVRALPARVAVVALDDLPLLRGHRVHVLRPRRHGAVRGDGDEPAVVRERAGNVALRREGEDRRELPVDALADGRDAVGGDEEVLQPQVRVVHDRGGEGRVCGDDVWRYALAQLEKSAKERGV